MKVHPAVGAEPLFTVSQLWNNCNEVHEWLHSRQKLLSILIWPSLTLALSTSRCDVYCLFSHTKMHARWGQGISAVLFTATSEQRLQVSSTYKWTAPPSAWQLVATSSVYRINESMSSLQQGNKVGKATYSLYKADKITETKIWFYIKSRITARGHANYCYGWQGTSGLFQLLEEGKSQQEMLLSSVVDD